MDPEERSIVGLTMLGHALVHTYELSIPVFIPVWLGSFDLTQATLGTVVAAGYALFGLGALPAGIVADRYGSRRLIVGCLVGMGVAFLGVSVAAGPLTLGLTLLLWGVAASVYHPAGLSLLSKHVARRGTALGYHGMAGNVGVALGPLATLVALSFFDWRVVAAALAVPALLVGLAAVALGLGRPRTPDTAGSSATPAASDDTPDGGTPPNASSDPDRGRDPFSLAAFLAESKALFRGGFYLVFGIVLFQGVFYRGVLTFLPDLLAGFDAFQPVPLAGRSLDPGRYLYAGLLAVGLLGQYAGGRLSDRVQPARGLLGIFATLTVVALLFVPAARAGAGPLLLVSALLGVALFGEQPMMQATTADYSGAGVRGLSYGYMYVGAFGIGALGAAITGVVLTYASPAVLFPVLACFTVLAGLSALALSRLAAPSDVGSAGGRPD